MAAAENHHRAPIPPPIAWLRRLLMPLLLLALTVGFYWKLVLTDQYTWLESPDLAYQVLPWYQFQAGEWNQGSFPLWDPYLWGGQSLIGQAQPGAAYPLNWLLFLLPLRNGWIRQAYLHWYFVLIHFLGVLFAYWLARDLKLSQPACVLAGVAFSFSGYVGTTDWPQMLNGAIWTPLVFLFLLRTLDGVRPLVNAALSGAFLGIAWLSGHHQGPIYMTLAASGVWLFYIFKRGLPEWALVRLAAVFLIFALLVGALQILPAYEYGKLSRRWVGVEEPVGWNQKVPYLVHTQYAFYPLSVLGILIPGVHRHSDPFAGVVITTLALLAVALAFRERAVRLLAAVALGGLLFSLGHNNVFHGIVYALAPLVDKARTPAAAILIFNFGFSLLSAYGMDRFLTSRESPWPRRACLALLAWSAALLLLSLATLVVGKQPEDRYALTALVALLAAAAFWGGWRGMLSPRAFQACLIALALIELGNVSGYLLPHRLEKQRTIYLKKMAEHSDLAEFIRNEPWPARVVINSSEIPYNFGDWYGVDVFGGYLASLTDNLLRLGLHSERVQNLMGATYFIASEPPRPGLREVHRGKSGLNVYFNPDALPRAWTIHALKGVADDNQAQALLDDPGFDLRRQGWIRGEPPQLEVCSPDEDSVRLLSREAKRVEIEARMACKGMVVLSEVYFPGWEARVDGKQVPVHEVYTALRGVVVERGLHRVEMRYRPRSVVLGGIGTFVGLTAACFLAWRVRRRTPREPNPKDWGGSA